MTDERRRRQTGNDANRRQYNNPGRRKLTKRQRRQLQIRYKIFSWILTAFFVVVFYALICACIGNRSLYSKTMVNDVDVGGMKSAEASKLVKKQLQSSYGAASVKVKLEDKTYTLDVSAALDMDPEEQILDIQNSTHSFWKRGYGMLESRIVGDSFTVYPQLHDREKLAKIIDGSNMMEVNLCTEDGYSIEDKKLIVTKGQGNYKVDTDKLVTLIKKKVNAGNYDQVVDCPIRATDVDIDAVYERVHMDPVDPTLDPDNDYEIVEAQDGVDFDLEEARKSIAEAHDGDRIEIPLTYTSADMSTDEYKALLFRDEISSYSTEVEGSDNRKENVRLAAQYCDGTVLMPGESFSYNLGVGELTEERGFKPGPSYADGQSVLDMGGGICQVSSTMYMACLYANLEIDERHCHPYPASYVPAGLDATVAWGGCDFIFTNDTDYPIKIVTTYDGYTTSCSIWGTVTEPFSVELYTETLDTEPYKTKYELDKSLGKDEQILDTVGIDGLTIQSYRRVYDGEGNVIYDRPESESVYSERDEVYKVGKMPKQKKKKTE